ncbi:histidine phosphatase family protein [Candidatus Woesearchaeota archaeon]|nr:MAG: hypothetical protein QS99_C0017G0023 [archaeon GW2011_AR4]MBS3130340.1 histidine phosphatase family protein [Candidatus Woesearchaeota archaeon]HIH38939.1 histidine phosphatase family protein [Candidatus Woesearchaeota archaeon]HIH48056.1 histidine phosphatase family protein [Candidatus Woesearchaeota archaeon]HIJ03400.1 histidine phosphatase family protein [Candidatus Woesearchaeota archaeon]
MNNTYYFLRHAATAVDKTKPVSQWVLSEEGKKQAERIAEHNVFQRMDIIICSEEEKAYQTSLFLSKKIEKPVIKFPGLKELNRDASGFLEKDAFEDTVRECMTRLYTSVRGWEKGIDALERFSSAIGELEDTYDRKSIVVVSHGLVINLYLAHLLGMLPEAHERMQQNTFCDFGIVCDGDVLKDIIQTKKTEPRPADQQEGQSAPKE